VAGAAEQHVRRLKMPRLLKIALVCLAAVGIFAGGYIFGVIVSKVLPGPARPPIDLSEVTATKNSKGSIEAILLHGSEREPFNFLGTDQKAYLGLRIGDATLIVQRDLLEGNGTYESAIVGVRWRGEDDVLIERTIQDKRDDIEFNVKRMKWRSAK